MSIAIEYSIAETLLYEEKILKLHSIYREALLKAKDQSKDQAKETIINALKLLVARTRKDLNYIEVEEAFDCDEIKTVIYLYYTKEFEGVH
jgi:hypothetical protein